MAPFIVAALVAAGLFGTGTAVKPENPQLGTTLQFAGIGTIAGGAIGAAAGVPSSLATSLGTTTVSSTVAATAAIGAGVGAATGIFAVDSSSAPISRSHK